MSTIEEFDKKQRLIWDQAFTLGFNTGKKQMLQEIIKVLGLDELIALAVARHEEQFHGIN